MSRSAMARRAAAALVAICGASVLIMLGGATSPAPGPRQSIILADAPAPTLAAYRLFLDAAARRPDPSLIPYALNTPLFSDYAVKTRYLYLRSYIILQQRFTTVLNHLICLMPCNDKSEFEYG